MSEKSLIFLKKYLNLEKIIKRVIKFTKLKLATKNIVIFFIEDFFIKLWTFYIWWIYFENYYFWGVFLVGYWLLYLKSKFMSG